MEIKREAPRPRVLFSHPRRHLENQYYFSVCIRDSWDNRVPGTKESERNENGTEFLDVFETRSLILSLLYSIHFELLRYLLFTPIFVPRPREMFYENGCIA